MERERERERQRYREKNDSEKRIKKKKRERERKKEWKMGKKMRIMEKGVSGGKKKRGTKRGQGRKIEMDANVSIQ